MSTRSSIWLGESDGNSVHIYWELADREIKDGRMTGAPIYIAVHKGDANKEIAVRLPRDVALQLLKILKADHDDEDMRVL